jgi:hypothetical protein
MNDTKPLPGSTDDPTELQLSYRTLPVDAISFPQDLWDPRIPPLTESGYTLAVPIIVTATSDSSYMIIDGCKRLRRVREQGRTSISCGILSHTPSEQELGLLRIMLNCGRPLHLREKRLFLAWLRATTDQPTCRSMLGRLGISAREQHDIQPLVNCRESVLEAVDSGWLHLPNLRDFLLFSVEDGDRFMALFKPLKLSQQSQREWIEWCQEIAAAHTTAVRQVLGDEAIAGILTNADLTAPQRIEKIRHILFQRRFPQLTAAETAWHELVRQCNPQPGRVVFSHDPFFEHNRLSVQISISQPDEAQTLLGGLVQISSENWRRLIYPLA